MTCLDGYQLARRGEPAARSALEFGIARRRCFVLDCAGFAGAAARQHCGILRPVENFAVVVMALILISSLSEGSFLKGLSAGLLGMVVSYPASTRVRE